jgi:hypothetical protein
VFRPELEDLDSLSAVLIRDPDSLSDPELVSAINAVNSLTQQLDVALDATDFEPG